jgi:hypothetical protein
MLRFNKLLPFGVLGACLFFSLFGWATATQDLGAQDLSYDELLQEIQTHKSTLQNSSLPLPPENLQFHGGLGTITSYSTIKAFNQKKHFEQSGMQFSVGADLFSKQWFTEGTFRNYGSVIQSDEELFLKQLDLKVGYRSSWRYPWTSRVGGGLSTRSLKYTDLLRRKSQEETSPAFLLWGGITAQLSPAIGLGFEVGGRAPFVNSQLDQGSFELALNIDFSI